ncbi:histone-lysine N-methyltransferase MECOM-like [Platichthys flesus]|uniref:histone-lysine N-methyltransferase MECOM-like n=1 Tax=Platichthys flesus TaxID=8260 RepID=UPI002DB7B524|nr:histone-lysine N-methyltransferase MECOM-like [Platichthys flesus]
MRSKGRARKLATSDGDDEFALYSSDLLDDVCGSDGDPLPSSALVEDPVSPLLSDDESSPQDPLSFQHPSFFCPEELTIPLDFELRESVVPGGGLGIWSRRQVNAGERFGPYEGERRPCLRDPTQGWENQALEESLTMQFTKRKGERATLSPGEKPLNPRAPYHIPSTVSGDGPAHSSA